MVENKAYLISLKATKGQAEVNKNQSSSQDVLVACGRALEMKIGPIEQFLEQFLNNNLLT